MIFFASDIHLGVDTLLSSKERERLFVQWLDSIKDQMTELYLVGDLFDYWYEYKHTVPKGYVRFFGKLAELKDAGKQIYVFTGNHDLWMRDYFTTELGIPVYHNPINKTILGKSFFIGHGDGLGPADAGYKFIKKVFTNKVCQWMFTRIHPNTAISLMRFFSQKSRESTEGHEFLGPNKEWLIQFSEEQLELGEPHDYFIFGHRHLPIDYTLSNKQSRYINLGDWTEFFSYAVFDGKELELKFYKERHKVYGI
jgi:UDP-2,3-diacylglucosamine hydrolase